MGAAQSLGPSVTALYACLLGISAVVALMLRAGLRGAEDDESDTFGPALEPIEVAYLAGGVVSAMESAVASVRHRVSAPADEPTHRRDSVRGVLAYDVLPVESAVYEIAARHGGPVEPARREAEPVLAPVRSRLTWLKLIAPEHSVRRVRHLQLLLFGALLALGLWWGAADAVGVVVVFAWADDHTGLAGGQSPNYLLLMLCGATAWLMAHVRPALPFRSRHGDRVLERLRAKHIALLWRVREQPYQLPAKDVALGVALFGEKARGEHSVVTFRRVGSPRPSGSHTSQL